MTTRITAATWMGLGLVLGMLGTSTWLQAQAAPAQLSPGQRLTTPKVYAGADIGFRVDGMRGEVPVVVPVVKVNGEWVEVEFGGGGIRKLTK